MAATITIVAPPVVEEPVVEETVVEETVVDEQAAEEFAALINTPPFFEEELPVDIVVETDSTTSGITLPTILDSGDLSSIDVQITSNAGLADYITFEVDTSTGVVKINPITIPSDLDDSYYGTQTIQITVSDTQGATTQKVMTFEI